MKPKVFLTLIFCMLIFFSACSGGEKSKTVNENSNSSSSEKTDNVSNSYNRDAVSKIYEDEKSIADKASSVINSIADAEKSAVNPSNINSTVSSAKEKINSGVNELQSQIEQEWQGQNELPIDYFN